MLLSIAMVGAFALRKRLVARHGSSAVATVAALFYVVAVVVVASILAPINEVPANFPAVTLWEFRID